MDFDRNGHAQEGSDAHHINLFGRKFVTVRTIGDAVVLHSALSYAYACIDLQILRSEGDEFQELDVQNILQGVREMTERDYGSVPGVVHTMLGELKAHLCESRFYQKPMIWLGAKQPTSGGMGGLLHEAPKSEVLRRGAARIMIDQFGEMSTGFWVTRSFKSRGAARDWVRATGYVMRGD